MEVSVTFWLFPQPTWRSHTLTNFDAKWLNRRGFTQGCAFCSKKSKNFILLARPQPPKRSKFGKFLDRKFSLDFAFNIGVSRVNTPYSSSEPNKSSVIVNRQCGGGKFKYVPKFWIGAQVRQRITFKLAMITFKCLRGLAPSYLADVCIPVSSVVGRWQFAKKLKSHLFGC